MYIHTLRDAAWNETAAEPTPKQSNNNTWYVSNHSRFCFCWSLNFSQAMRTNHMCWLRSHRNNSCQNSRTILCLGRSEGACGRHSSDRLCISWRCSHWWCSWRIRRKRCRLVVTHFLSLQELQISGVRRKAQNTRFTTSLCFVNPTYTYTAKQTKLSAPRTRRGWEKNASKTPRN